MIGAQSAGVRSRPCQALNCVGSRYGCSPCSPGTIVSSCSSRLTIKAPTTAAAELRVTVDSSTAIDGHAQLGRRGRRGLDGEPAAAAADDRAGAAGAAAVSAADAVQRLA